MSIIEAGSIARPFNHYICQKCRRPTIAKHEDEGVTPATLTCRATPGCLGLAVSTFYTGSQNPKQVPHIIWFRPATYEDAVQWINEHVFRKHRVDVLEHYEQGGALWREVLTKERVM